MNLCLLVIALSALICAVATSFSLLVAMRVAAGLVAGGIFPVADRKSTRLNSSH